MPKSIIELCRQLPSAEVEAELRARADEFNDAVALAVFGWKEVRDADGFTRYVNSNGRSVDALDVDFLYDITDAKAATDALHWDCWIRCYRQFSPKPAWEVEMIDRAGKTQSVEVRASTEQLARSACALLAAAG